MDVNSGEVFYAHNRYMTPPKAKFHLCVSDKLYFIINTKPAYFNQVVTPEDCSLLAHESYINCGTVRIEPMRGFKIIKKEELGQNCLKGLIEKIKVVPTLNTLQKDEIIGHLCSVLNKKT